MKEIDGFPGYFVTPDGKVYSNWKHSCNPKGELKEMSQWNSSYGYKMVTLCGGRNKLRVHRLVAEAYIPNPNNLPQVNHINEDKSDNRVENLEWMNSSDNIEYSRSKLYILENKNGDKFEVYNLRKWCRNNKIDRRDMYNTFKGRHNWTKNHRIVSIHELTNEERQQRLRGSN